MKTPPLLLGATLLFWGWQTGFFLQGAVMALILESSRLIKTRWEFSDDDFARIWTFSCLLFLAAAVFAFNNNGGPTNFGNLFLNPNLNDEQIAGNVGALTALNLIRWLPMIFFLFIAAQTFSHRAGVSLEAISLYLRRRSKKARKSGQPLPPSRRVNVLYPYFALCLFSASGHSMEDNSFYFGLCALLAWSLWPLRSRRFNSVVWVGALALIVIGGFFGQRGIVQITRFTEEYPGWLVRFLIRRPTDPMQSETGIGHIGEMRLSGKIVIRLEPQNSAAPPVYLREATYRSYRSPNWHFGWHSGNRRSSRSDFSTVSEIPVNSENWPLQTGATNSSAIHIACYLDGYNRQDGYPEGLLPLPVDCGRLEKLPAYLLQKNSGGAVLAEGPRFIMFDARFGSGATIDALPEADGGFFTNEDLRVPTNEIPALKKIVSQLNVSSKSDEEKIFTIGKFFADNFKYSLWQDAPKNADTNSTPLARFLLDTRSGHCEYFATATVLLLRELGIPARYAVGYFVHEQSGSGYVVRERDAHSWCLVWNKKNRVWQNFDTTPGAWVADEEKRASPFQFLSDFQSWLGFEIAKFRYGQSNFRQYVLWALIPALGFFLYRIFRGNRRHQKKNEIIERMNWPGLDSEFYRLEQKLIRFGLPREAGEPLSIWLQRATNDSRLAKLKQPLENVLLLHYRHRFDPRGLDFTERKMLRQEVENLKDEV